ncbi:MAG: tetratricopeptide repeat protein [Planctomycetota bacterium]
MVAPAMSSQVEPMPLDPVQAAVDAARHASAEGSLEQAIAQLQSAKAAGGGCPELSGLLAGAFIDAGRFEEALAELDSSDSGNTTDPRGQFQRARALRGLHRLQDAESWLRKALAQYPTYDRARLELVDLLLERGAGGVQGALGELQTLQERQAGRPEVALLKARAQHLAGHGVEAETTLRGQLDHPEVRFALSRMLIEEGRAAEAWQVAEPLVFEVTRPEERLFLAQVARRADQPLIAMQLVSVVMLKDPGHPVALSELDGLLQDPRALGAALQAQRLAAQPEDRGAWIALCDGMIDAGRYAEVIQRLSQVPETLAKDPELMLRRGRALRHLGKETEARAALEPLAANGNGPASYELGLVEYAAGAFRAAEARFAKGACGDFSADAHFNRGVCLDQLQEFDGAAEAYRAALVARPGFAEAWLQLGHDLRLRLGRANEARAAYRHYLDLGGDDPEVRRFVGDGQ